MAFFTHLSGNVNEPLRNVTVSFCLFYSAMVCELQTFGSNMYYGDLALLHMMHHRFDTLQRINASGGDWYSQVRPVSH